MTFFSKVTNKKEKLTTFKVFEQLKGILVPKSLGTLSKNGSRVEIKSLDLPEEKTNEMNLQR